MAVLVAWAWVSWRMDRSRLRAATGSPGWVMCRAMTRHAMTATAASAAARRADVAATRGVGVPGQAWAVRPWMRADAHRMPNGRTRPPAKAAASQAAAHTTQARLMAPQKAAMSVHASAALLAANGGRGPRARL